MPGTVPFESERLVGESSSFNRVRTVTTINDASERLLNYAWEPTTIYASLVPVCTEGIDCRAAQRKGTYTRSATGGVGREALDGSKACTGARSSKHLRVGNGQRPRTKSSLTHNNDIRWAPVEQLDGEAQQFCVSTRPFTFSPSICTKHGYTL